MAQLKWEALQHGKIHSIYSKASFAYLRPVCRLSAQTTETCTCATPAQLESVHHRMDPAEPYFRGDITRLQMIHNTF